MSSAPAAGDSDRPGSTGAPTRVTGTADTGRMLRSSAVVGLGTALSRVTGFVRVAAIAYALGASTVSGVYAYANETPNIVYELLLGGVLTATLVPLFVRHLERGDDDAASAIVTVSLVALVGITAIGIALAPWIVRLYTIGVSGPHVDDQRDLATMWLRCFMPQMFFYGLAALAGALLNARRRFAAAAFTPILNNVVVIALFLSLPRFADGPITVQRLLDDSPLLLLIGLGTTAGIAAMALALVPAVRRARIRVRPLFAWRHTAVRTMFRLSGWTVGYVVVNQIALWVVLVLANDTSGGPFIYLSAYAFFMLPHGLFSVSIMTTVQPELASAHTRGNWPALRHRFARGLRLILTLMVPASAVFIGLSRPIVVALLQRGAFGTRGSTLVAETLVGFAVGLPAFSVYLYALRLFYAMHDTRTPFLLNSLENALNIVLALALSPVLGISGLAVAFSCSYVVAAVVTLAVASRRLGGLQGRQVGSTAARVVVAGGAVAVATWAVADALGWAGARHAILTTGVGLVVAAAVAVTGLLAMRVAELRELAAVLPLSRPARARGRDTMSPVQERNRKG